MQAQTTISGTTHTRLHRRASRLRTLAVALPLLLLGACAGSDGPTGSGSPAVAAVEIAAPATTLPVGTTAQLTATPRDGSGAAVQGVAVTWASSDERVAMVSTAGTVTARAVGEAVISASGGGRTGRVTVTVGGPRVASLAIAPAGDVVLARYAHVQLYAVARGVGGEQIDGAAITWSSSDSLVARVTATGAVHGGVAGTAVVRAVSGDVAAEVRVRVPEQVARVEILPLGRSLKVGARATLAVRITAADGTELQRAVGWTSENTSVATVDAAGTVTAHRPGSTTVRAAVEGVIAEAVVSVVVPSEFDLKRAGGNLLPEQVATRTRRDADGMLHTQQVLVTGGVFRLNGNRYEQGLTLAVYEGGVFLRNESWRDSGEVMYDVFSGDPIFRSTEHGGASARGRFTLVNGYIVGIAVDQNPAGNGPAVTFSFD